LRRNNVGEQANLAVLQARLLHASPYLDRWRPLGSPSGRPADSHRLPLDAATGQHRTP
jgi:hypothetical protein